MSQPGTYQNLHLQYIAGEWRPGRSGRTLEDRSPYDQQLLATIPMASREDLDAPMHAPRRPSWPGRPLGRPNARPCC